MMAACNKIYIFCTGGLQFQTDIYKLSLIYNPAKSILTNLIVLTKGTAQSTACKKDSSASAENSYKRFLTKVKSCEGNAKVGGFAAKAERGGGTSVHTTLTRALAALFI